MSNNPILNGYGPEFYKAYKKHLGKNPETLGNVLSAMHATMMDGAKDFHPGIGPTCSHCGLVKLSPAKPASLPKQKKKKKK